MSEGSMMVLFISLGIILLEAQCWAVPR